MNCSPFLLLGLSALFLALASAAPFDDEFADYDSDYSDPVDYKDDVDEEPKPMIFLTFDDGPGTVLFLAFQLSLLF